jgi:hypothetical protein
VKRITPAQSLLRRPADFARNRRKLHGRGEFACVNRSIQTDAAIYPGNPINLARVLTDQMLEIADIGRGARGFADAFTSAAPSWAPRRSPAL